MVLDPSSGLHLLNGNGLTPKQREKVANQNATLGEVEAIAVKVAEFYHQQTAELCAQVVAQVVPVIVAEILKQHGIELQGPASEVPVPCRCGTETPPETVTAGARFYVRCPVCLDCERGTHETESGAIAAWNRASQVPAPTCECGGAESCEACAGRAE